MAEGSAEEEAAAHGRRRETGALWGGFRVVWGGFGGNGKERGCGGRGDRAACCPAASSAAVCMLCSALLCCKKLEPRFRMGLWTRPPRVFLYHGLDPKDVSLLILFSCWLWFQSMSIMLTLYIDLDIGFGIGICE